MKLKNEENKMNIKELIASMLTENTGSHILDSGGAYGRNWERQKGKTVQDFEKEPAATLEVYKWEDKDGHSHIEASATVNVYHHLTNCLELDEICNKFNSKPVHDWDSDICGVSQKGAKRLERWGFEVGNSWNTYNWCSSHSQVLQGTDLELNGENYVLIQIHGGCDVRGGYSDAKLFKVIGEAYNVVVDDCMFSIPSDNERGFISLEWHGEWINQEGASAQESDFLAFAEYAKGNAIHGDICEWC